MSVSDNFDYSIPTLTRNQTMYLDTINKNDALIRPFKKLYTQRNWSANLYNLDIDCSIPRRFGVFTNKVDFINKNDDIERTNPRILHYPLNKPEYNLTNADIEKSSPQIHHLNTKRCIDPLEPKYNLAKVEDYPPEVPKFLRETNYIKDIYGTHPQKYFQWKQRETFPLDNFGIQGSKTKPKYVRTTVGKMKYHYLDYSDLTRDIFKTSRHISPLDPIYQFNPQNKSEKPYTIGMIEKSKPQTFYPYHYDPAFNLKTDDIPGCAAGTKNKISKFQGKNFAYNTKDIRGASVGSLKKGISTTRCTNPLNPKYQYLGEIELNKCKDQEYSEKNINNDNKSNINNNKNDINKRKKSMNNCNNNEIIADTEINNKEGNDKNKETISQRQMSHTFSNGFNNIKNNINKIVTNNKKEKIIKTPSVRSAFSDPGKELVVNNFEEQKNCEFLSHRGQNSECPSVNNEENHEYKNPYDHGYNQFQAPISSNKRPSKKLINKPDPNYGYIHEPCIQSSENQEHLREIEGRKMMQKTMYMANMGTNGFLKMENRKKNFDLEELTKNKKDSSNSSKNISEMSKMNKTFGFGFRNKKATYAQKLDQFMQENKMPFNISNFNNNFNQPKKIVQNSNNNMNINTNTSKKPF